MQKITGTRLLWTPMVAQKQAWEGIGSLSDRLCRQRWEQGPHQTWTDMTPFSFLQCQCLLSCM